MSTYLSPRYNWPVTLEKLRGRLLISLAFGALVFVGLSAYADFSDVIDGLGASSGTTCRRPGLTSRQLRAALLQVAVLPQDDRRRRLPGAESALVYFAGLGMVVTPGKVGEWLKCYLLRELHGTPFSRSAPIIIAERLTDSLGAGDPRGRRPLRLRRCLAGLRGRCRAAARCSSSSSDTSLWPLAASTASSACRWSSRVAHACGGVLRQQLRAALARLLSAQ